MSSYTVLISLNTSLKNKRTHRLNVLLSGVEDKAGARAALAGIARDLMADNDEMVVYAYLEKQAVQWNGYIARMKAVRGQEPVIVFDNDPELRRQVYLSTVD